MKEFKEYSLAENLYQCRKESGKTQKEIADYLGIKQAAYSKYEVGETEPKISTLLKLARYFEIDLNTLVGFSPLSPYEKAVKHIKHIAPDSHIEKNDNGEIRCIISRQGKELNLKKIDITIATDNDLVTCVNLADKTAVQDLQETYNDLFIMYFATTLTLMRNKNIEKGYLNYGVQAIENNKEKQLKSLIKKIEFKPDTTGKRKTRSDKKGGK